MKTTTDLYTKVVLTVIAVFLGVIVFRDIAFVEKAQAAPLHLTNKEETSEVIDVNIVRVDGRLIFGSVPVEVKNTVSVK